MSSVPQLREEDDGVSILLAPGPVSRTAEFECVLDLDDFGVVIGVEILSFDEQLNAAVPISPTSGRPRWSLDEEMDAFYLRVQEGRVSRQEKAVGVAEIEGKGTLASLRVPRGVARS